MPTSVYLEELFNSGKTFDEITALADEYFETKYPAIPFSALCEGAYRDGDFVKYQRWKAFWKNHLTADRTLGDFTKNVHFIPKSGSDRGADCDDFDFGAEWTNINYASNMGLQIDQGRTNVIAFHPTDEDIFFVGAAWGGLWKTTDGGESYTLLNDNLPLSAVCGIALDPDNPDKIAVALSDIVWYGPAGLGVFISEDGGLNFTPTDLSWGLSENVKTYYMDQSPNNPNHMIIATSDGLYKTTDFFETSSRVLDANMRSVKYSRSTSGLVFAGGEGGSGAWETPFKLDPSDHNRIVVGYNSVYESDDNGDTWSVVGDEVSPGADLQQLAIAPSNPDKIYASQGRVLYIKEPGESEWTQIVTPVFSTITDLEVDPEDEDVIYICYNGYIDEEKVYKSEDGGENWTNITANLPNLPFLSLELYHDEPGAVL